MLKIYNSQIQKKEIFKPIKEKEISMYVCGPTLYDEIHVGNARPLIFFDIVYRFLEIAGYKVKYVSNITDIDDKIINRAEELNISEKELININYQKYLQILKELNIKENLKRPKVTDYIEEIIKFIEQLIAEEFAYIGENGDVYFRIKKIKNYGTLSNRKIADLIAGSRIDINHYKENELDFVLWKKTTKGITWAAPFGKGRPGWHTECVVMIREILGEKIDIHGGGMDLKFPHHENENAQSNAISGNNLANYWIHNGFVELNNEKMSKSLNNFITVRELLEKYNGNIIRLALLQTNYRQPINLSNEFLEQTNKINNKIQAYWQNITDEKIQTTEEIISILEDDFNTPNLISELMTSIKTDNKKNFLQICYILGIIKEEQNTEQLPENIKNLIEERQQFKKEKNFIKADLVKDEIYKLGYKITDTREGLKIEKIK